MKTFAILTLIFGIPLSIGAGALFNNEIGIAIGVGCFFVTLKNFILFDGLGTLLENVIEINKSLKPKSIDNKN